MTKKPTQVLTNYLYQLAEREIVSKKSLVEARLEREHQCEGEFQRAKDRRPQVRFQSLYNKTVCLRPTGDAALSLFLGKEFELSDPLKLYIMTPSLRRFPHVADYFHNLRELGYQFMQVKVNSYIITSPGLGKSSYENVINDMEFKFLTSKTQKNIMDKKRLENFLDKSGFLMGLIYPETNRPLTHNIVVDHGIDALYLLIGVIYKDLGLDRADKFVDERILGGKGGLLMTKI